MNTPVNQGKKCRGMVHSRMCEKAVLPNKGYCADHEERFSCAKCRQEILSRGTTVKIGDKYTQKEGTTKVRHLCWSCWEQEKDNWKEKFKSEECFVFGDFFYDSGQLSGNTLLLLCPICDNWHFESKFNETCSANCQRKYDSLSSQQKEDLKVSQTRSSSYSSSSTEREREREKESNVSKSNYLPWILGGVGIVVLIVGLVWYFTRKESR